MRRLYPLCLLALITPPTLAAAALAAAIDRAAAAHSRSARKEVA